MVKRLLYIIVFLAVILFFQNCSDSFKSNLENSIASSGNQNPENPAGCEGADCENEIPPEEEIEETFEFPELMTQGNQIVDENGTAVRIAAMNWVGTESYQFAPIGLYAQPWRRQMRLIKESGFNAIRLPFSLESLTTDREPNNINFTLNPDLEGLRPVNILDLLIDEAERLGLRVILDCHRKASQDGQSGTDSDGIWFSNDYPETAWIQAWEQLAAKYLNRPHIIGADLFNEPHSTADVTVVWGGGGIYDWARAAETAASAILAVNPRWLIFVEGISGYPDMEPFIVWPRAWWAQNLEGVENRPIVPMVDGQAVTNKVVYSPHSYPPSVFGGPAAFYDSPEFPENMGPVWDKSFGYIYKQNIAPIWIGEFGANLTGMGDGDRCSRDLTHDPAWLRAFAQYFDGDFDLDGTRDIPAQQKGMSWAYFAWGYSDCQTHLFYDVRVENLDTEKLEFLAPYQDSLF